METNMIQLTHFAPGAGCGCKIAPQVLEEILGKNINTIQFPNLLIGNEHNEDAAVYLLNENEALIATTDFFTPIVDDPFLFGQVAAANAISDVYAMGGRPILALGILAWPIDKLPVSIAQQVLEGAKAMCHSLSIPLAGGHSIENAIPVFGLSVNGSVNVKHLKRNSTAQEGDALFITKPIGVGILATASKKEKITSEDYEVFKSQLLQTNQIGAEIGAIDAVHAMTDVSGFGLLGHLYEMAAASKLSAIINLKKVPILSAARNYAQQQIMPDASFKNWNQYSKHTKIEHAEHFMEAFQFLPDPQTNGPLLIAVAAQAVSSFQDFLAAKGYEQFLEPIGTFINAQETTIIVQ